MQTSPHSMVLHCGIHLPHCFSAQRFRMDFSINYSLVCWFKPAYICIVLTKIRNVFASVMLVVKQCHELSTVLSGHSYTESRCAAANQLRCVLRRRINCVFSSSSKIVFFGSAERYFWFRNVSEPIRKVCKFCVCRGRARLPGSLPIVYNTIF